MNSLRTFLYTTVAFCAASSAFAQSTATVTGTASMASISLADRANFQVQVQNFGSNGIAGSQIGAMYGTTAQQAALYTAPDGSHPLAWITNEWNGGVVQSMTSQADSPQGSTTFNFVETWSGGIGNFTEKVAAWQDPGQMYLFPQVGNNITASCLPSNDTIVAIDGTPGDANYGTITLSAGSVSDCPTGTVFTIQPSTSQFEALSPDWIALESALYVAQEGQNSGHNANRTVVLPDYQLFPERPVLFYSWNSNIGNHIAITGTMGLSSINNWVDFGPGKVAIGPSSMSSTSIGTRYSNFSLLGPLGQNGSGENFVVGQTNTQGNGLGFSAAMEADHVSVSGYRAGFYGIADHWKITDSMANGNVYGVEFAPLTQSMGNQVFKSDVFTANSLAGIAIAASDQLDSGTITDTHLGFEPYGFLKLAKDPTEVNPGGFVFVSNSYLRFWQEATAEGMMVDQSGQGDIDLNIFNMVLSNNGDTHYPGDAISNTPAVATIQTRNFVGNHVSGPNDLSDFSQTSTAVVQATGTCQGNMFMGEDALIANGGNGVNEAHPALVCGNDGGGNNFVGAWMGAFYYTGSHLKKGQPVTINSAGQLIAYGGGSLLGVVPVDCGINAMCPVVRSGTRVPVFLDPTQTNGSLNAGVSLRPQTNASFWQNTGSYISQVGVMDFRSGSGQVGYADYNN